MKFRLSTARFSHRKLIVLGVAILIFLGVSAFGGARVYAYFDLGTVAVSTGTANISLTVGHSAVSSVSIKPSSKAETAGCGMAGCPQTCGAGCLDKNGQCTCAGTAYSTYYPVVSVSSSNSSVASASYSNGVVTVKGVSAGTATITLTAKLRQYRDGADEVKVVVATAPTTTKSSASVTSSTASSIKSTSGSTNSGPSTTTAGVQVVEVSTTVPPTASSTSSNEPSTRTITDAHGRKIALIRLNGTTALLTDLQKVGSDVAFVTFFTADEAGNVNYSWTFNRASLQSVAADLELGLTLSDSSGGQLGELANGNKTLILSCSQNGPLPGTATLAVKVGSKFPDGTSLDAFSYDQQSGSLKKLSGGLAVSNGYASLAVSQTGVLVLRTSGADGGFFTWWVMTLIGVAGLLIVGVAVFLLMKKTWNPFTALRGGK